MVRDPQSKCRRRLEADEHGTQKKETLGQSEDLVVDSPAYDRLRSQLQRIAECDMLSVESQRSAKHTADQLEFLKKEHRTLRSQLLAYKTMARNTEESCEALRRETMALRDDLSRMQRQKREAQDEARALARNHQSMTHQLHTTMQMLVSLVPLAKRVYGSGADEFLSSLLSQAAGSESTSLSTIDISGGDVGTPALPRRRPSAVQLVKQQLQKSVLAHGCLHTWAHSSPPPNVPLESQQERSQSVSRQKEEEEDAEDDYDDGEDSTVSSNQRDDIVRDADVLKAQARNPTEATSNQESHEHEAMAHALPYDEQGSCSDDARFISRRDCFLVEAMVDEDEDEELFIA
ncbi:hypothetical protein PINS_up003906 [Pythium insidiosum]|nr:hypothetical protein PINS_up003906 [Pythium insidiosum]